MNFEPEPAYRHRHRPDIPLEADTSTESNGSVSGGEESKKRKIGAFTRSVSVGAPMKFQLTPIRREIRQPRAEQRPSVQRKVWGQSP